MTTYNCQECGTEIQGASELCVSCFRKLTKPCPKCRGGIGSRGVPVIKRDRKGKPIDCDYCKNERWILAR